MSLGPEFFADFYRRSESPSDPWGFTARWYEQRKRALTLAALPRQHFARAFEPGCSVGVLTEQLSARCGRLLATDIAQEPLEVAAARLAAQVESGAVVLERRRVPQEWPPGTVDLVVLSEVGYYCGADDLELLVSLAATSLADDGVLLACHWRHRVADYPLTGDAVHEALRAHPRLGVLAEHVEEDFRLDVLVPAPVVSVARATGLL